MNICKRCAELGTPILKTQMFAGFVKWKKINNNKNAVCFSMAQMQAQRGQQVEAVEEETFGPLPLSRLEVTYTSDRFKDFHHVKIKVELYTVIVSVLVCTVNLPGLRGNKQYFLT